MALINNIYVLAEKEDLDRDVELTTHPTESGFPITDSVKRKPTSVSISGKIANTENLTTQQTIDKLDALKNSGSVIKYVGQCGTINNLQIESFKYTYSYKNFGGADFTMTLKEFKTAQSAYVKPESGGGAKVSTALLSQTFAVGGTVKFAGGNVYLSSDAANPSAKRGSSTCRLTKISTLANAKHKYHLVSLDCKYGSSNYVFGWVDADKVSAIMAIPKSVTNGGNQQVQAISKDVVYHTVKKGETVYELVTDKYKSQGLTVSEVIKDNPTAFSIANKATTLQVGARLKLGTVK